MIATGVIAIPVIALCIFLLKLPEMERQIGQIQDTKDRITTQNELYKTILQIAGGAVLIAGFYFTWKTIHVTQEGQITDRFNKAVDHLGQDNMSVRLGGIYALARIASDSEKDAQTVVQIFTAFIRDATANSSLPVPAQDVRSILALLGSGEWGSEAIKDLSGCGLQGLELKDADLRNWVFIDADLSEANLERSRLDGANLSGAILANTYLRDCGLQGSDLQAANLGGATLRKARLQKANIFGADLDNASLYGANFDGATGAVRQQFATSLFDETTKLPEFRADLD